MRRVAVDQQIIGKTPKPSAAVPAMLQAIMPNYPAEVKAKMKANGAELKL